MRRARVVWVAAILGALGGWLLAVNLALLVRGLAWPRARHVSGIPLIGGAALCVAMAMIDATRAWCWVPVVMDPMGLVAIGIAVVRLR